MGRHFKDWGTLHGPYCSCKQDVITEATFTAAAFWQNQDPNTSREGEIHLVVAKGESVRLTYLRVISGLSSRKGQNWASISALWTGVPAASSLSQGAFLSRSPLETAASGSCSDGWAALLLLDSDAQHDEGQKETQTSQPSQACVTLDRSPLGRSLTTPSSRGPWASPHIYLTPTSLTPGCFSTGRPWAWKY